MILIGSKALEAYIGDIGRIIHDYDILMTNVEWMDFHKINSQYLIKTVNNIYLYEIPNKGIVEVYHELSWTDSDRIICEAAKLEGSQTTSPFGILYLPMIQHLYDIKKATCEFIDEPKHKYDLMLMDNWNKNLAINEYNRIYDIRRIEIKLRLEKSNKVKYDFFHKYHIPEYIKHDYLHEVIADLLDIKLPTYQRITNAEVNISEELFNKLSYDQKISLMVEESLVLALERWFCPQMIENGINYKLLSIFDNNNEGLPTYKILKHCCITGLQGEAEYITGFARENFFEIEKEWIKAKAKIVKKNGFKSEFYEQIFELREKYKNGEKVGTI